MCKKCSKKNQKSPKIPFEIMEEGTHYYLIGVSANRIGLVGHYVVSSDYYLRNRSASLKKLIKFDNKHKEIIGDIFSNDFPIIKNETKFLTTTFG